MEGETCDFCKEKLDPYKLPFECSYCGGTFCPEHRLPESHECKLDYKHKDEKIAKNKEHSHSPPLIGKKTGDGEPPMYDRDILYGSGKKGKRRQKREKKRRMKKLKRLLFR